jgi:hypothetical protein
MVAQVGWHRVWSVPCTRRREARISWSSLKTKVDGLSVVWPQNHWDGFSRFGFKTGGDGSSWFGLKTGGGWFLGLDLKTDNFSLVIWALKSPQRFLGLGLKIKRDTVCQLRHKADGRMKMARGTRRDLAACFAWKQIGAGFLSLASRLANV